MTKFTSIILSGALCGAALLTAQDKKAEEKKPANQPADVTIPAGATQTEDGTYHYTDAKGKKWQYRKTPFGIARSEEKPPVDTPVLEDTNTKATVNGDNVHFERQTPFGVAKWDKKMTDLDVSEKRILEHQKTKQ